MINWHDISYLKNGSKVQQQVHSTLLELQIMEKLHEFRPLLAGTFPIGLNIAGSDLDIICTFDHPSRFYDALQLYFSHYHEFVLKRKAIRGFDTLIARFVFSGFNFEVFGQAVPIEHQYAYRHMLIEHALLQQKGTAFRQKVITLKQKGLSTEEAFAKLLNIHGDPYLGLLEYGAGI